MRDLNGVEYMPAENGIADSVKCPLIEDWISPVDCMENQDIAEQFIPQIFKNKPNWKRICADCPFRNY